MTALDPYRLSAEDLEPLLDPQAPLLPDLEASRDDPSALASSPQAQHVLGSTEALMAGIRHIPQTTYTHYRYFLQNGDRSSYETPYFAKRTQLAAAALRLYLGLDGAYPDPGESPYPKDLKATVQDYLWNICEETTWVLPAHEQRPIDLFSAETSFVLAETLTLLGDTLDGEVRLRVRREIESRTLEPYVKWHEVMGWYRGTNNWNGVCNSSVMASFLHLWPSTDLVAQALEIALEGLRVFLDSAFETDGSSTEGVAYWHYGLINFVALSEMLRSVTGGKLDLLASEHLRKVAAYPAQMHLSGPYFASFSDCDETLQFNPGIVSRLAERTGESSLYTLLARPAKPGADWRLTMMLRNLLWWDGSQDDQAAQRDAVLPVGATAKLIGQAKGTPVVLAIKAGHNAENHNQNDIGSFLVHVGGENLLVDPGRGLYTRDYFSAKRYDNVFASAYGHSVPRVGGQLQKEGREFAGKLLASDTSSRTKIAEVEMAGAYDVPELETLRRKVSLDDRGVVVLEDDLQFSGEPLEVEEALMTWGEVEVEGAKARIKGSSHALELDIEEPAGARFALEALEEASRANEKDAVLKRLTFKLPPSAHTKVRVRIEVGH